MNLPKTRGGSWLKIINGKPILFDIPPFKEWCKEKRLPCDKISRSIYNQWKMDAPTLLGVIQHIINNDIDKAKEMLNTISDEIYS